MCDEVAAATTTTTDGRTEGPNVKNPPKFDSKKFVKLAYHNYACNSLTNFECKTHARKRKNT